MYKIKEIITRGDYIYVQKIPSIKNTCFIRKLECYGRHAKGKKFCEDLMESFEQSHCQGIIFSKIIYRIIINDN